MSEPCAMYYVLGGSMCEDCLSEKCKMSPKRKHKEKNKTECLGNFCIEWIVTGDELCKKCDKIEYIRNPKK